MRPGNNIYTLCRVYHENARAHNNQTYVRLSYGLIHKTKMRGISLSLSHTKYIPFCNKGKNRLLVRVFHKADYLRRCG